MVVGFKMADFSSYMQFFTQNLYIFLGNLWLYDFFFFLPFVNCDLRASSLFLAAILIFLIRKFGVNGFCNVEWSLWNISLPAIILFVFIVGSLLLGELIFSWDFLFYDFLKIKDISQNFHSFGMFEKKIIIS